MGQAAAGKQQQTEGPDIWHIHITGTDYKGEGEGEGEGDETRDRDRDMMALAKTLASLLVTPMLEGPLAQELDGLTDPPLASAQRF